MIEDEELTCLSNSCADLVTLKTREAFPVHLLTGNRAGEWIRVQQLCLQAGLDAGDVKPDLFASWLADPAGDEDYALIIFYDEESMWTMAARYNRQRVQTEYERRRNPEAKTTNA